jgi:hypothetical protein
VPPPGDAVCEGESRGEALPTPAGVPDTVSAALGDDDQVGKPVAHALGVGDAVPPRASEGLCVPLTDAEREGLPLGEALAAGEAEALALTLPPPSPAAVEEGEMVPLPLGLTAPTLGVRGALTVAQPLALAQRLGLPLGEAVRVTPPGSEGEGVPDSVPLRVAAVVGLPLNDGATEGEGERDGCSEGEGEAEAHWEGRALPLKDPEPLPHAEAVAPWKGDPVRAIDGELHTLPLPPPLREGEPLTDALPLMRATVGEGDAEPERVCARLGEAEPLALALPLLLALAAGDALPEALAHEDALPHGLPEAEPLREGEPEPLPQALALRVTVGEREALPHALALRVMVGEGDAEVERLPLPLLEALPHALRLRVGEPVLLALAEALRHSVGLPEALGGALALRLRVGDTVAVSHTVSVRVVVPRPLRLAEIEA